LGCAHKWLDFLRSSEKGFSTKTKNDLNDKGRPKMRKRKLGLSSMIVIYLLLGFLQPTIVNAVEDVSGEWSGRWN
jgi:hypothetical protein